MEREALAKISERGGLVHYTRLADMMRISRYYAHLICDSLGRDDYIDVDAVGRCKITPKGENFLKEEMLLLKYQVEKGGGENGKVSERVN